MKSEILKNLKTAVLGQSLNIFEETASTNDLARDRARSGGHEGETFMALKQTQGRGRLGRHWESPAGKNLLLSILLRPACSLQDASLLPLVAGAAVFDTFSSIVPEKRLLTLKWPNDVYYKDRKIAGILCEMESEAESVRYVICGAGMNINSEEEDFPPEIRNRAISLKTITGHQTPLPVIAALFLNALEKRYQSFLKEGPAGLIGFCNDHSYLKDKKVLFDSPEGLLSGVARSLSPQGHLLVETHEGLLIPVFSGDITVKEVHS